MGICIGVISQASLYFPCQICYNFQYTAKSRYISPEKIYLKHLVGSIITLAFGDSIPVFISLLVGPSVNSEVMGMCALRLM